MDYVLENFFDNVRRRKDDMIWQALEKHGYSKEWCLDPNNNHRITIDCYAVCGETLERLVVKVDGIELFSVVTTLTIDMENMKSNIGISIVDFTENK